MTDRETTIAELRDLVRRFVAEREWQPFHDAKNLSMSIAIEAAELMEHFQWVRSERIGEALGDPALHDAVRDELADVVCYVLALANVANIDIAEAVAQKMQKNSAKYPAGEFRGRYEKPR